MTGNELDFQCPKCGTHSAIKIEGHEKFVLVTCPICGWQEGESEAIIQVDPLVPSRVERLVFALIASPNYEAIGRQCQQSISVVNLAIILDGIIAKAEKHG